MGSQAVSVHREFQADLATAVTVLREHGAQEIYVYGSAIDPFEGRVPNDIDIAVTGLSGRAFLHAYGVLLGTLDHPFDLVELDARNRFSQRLRERGELERVG